MRHESTSVFNNHWRLMFFRTSFQTFPFLSSAIFRFFLSSLINLPIDRIHRLSFDGSDWHPSIYFGLEIRRGNSWRDDGTKASPVVDGIIRIHAARKIDDFFRHSRTHRSRLLTYSLLDPLKPPLLPRHEPGHRRWAVYKVNFPSAVYE